MTASKPLRWATISDSELISQVRLDDPGWLEEIFSRHGSRLRGCAHRMVHPREVEDATQEISERILKGLPRFRGDSSLGTWLYAVARNTCLDVRRRRKAESTVDDETIDGFLGAASPERDFNLSVLGCRTAVAVRQLPESQAQVVLLRLGQGLSTAETAARLEITEDAVKTRLTRARRRLRSSLAEAIACRECGPGYTSIEGPQSV